MGENPPLLSISPIIWFCPTHSVMSARALCRRRISLGISSWQSATNFETVLGRVMIRLSPNMTKCLQLAEARKLCLELEQVALLLLFVFQPNLCLDFKPTVTRDHNPTFVISTSHSAWGGGARRQGSRVSHVLEKRYCPGPQFKRSQPKPPGHFVGGLSGGPPCS